MPFVNGEKAIISKPVIIPAIPIGGIISSQILIPVRVKPRRKKNNMPRDCTLFDPQRGQGAQFSCLIAIPPEYFRPL